MAVPASLLRRAVLYVPGSSTKMLDKARALQVDCVAYDLEDSVSSSLKATARAMVRQHLSGARASGIRENAVRINAADTGLALADLTEILQSPNLDAIVVPKVQSASDLDFVTHVIRHCRPEGHAFGPTEPLSKPLRILALIESARAIMDLKSICSASPYLSGLMFASEDFAFDLSITRTPSLTEFLFARSSIVAACRAYGLESAIDLVCTSFKGPEGQKVMAEECEGGRVLGFSGKQCIHPSQVAIAHKAYSPSQKDLEWAVRVTIADKKANQRGFAAWTLDGKMIDVPVAKKAKSIVEKAQLADMPVSKVLDQWKDQEPE